MPDYFYNNNIIPEDQLISLAEGKNMSLDELLQSMPDIVVKEKEADISSPGININTTKEDTASTGINITGLQSDNGSLELPQITEKETKLVEELGIRELQKKLSGLGFTFQESSLIGGADWMPGSDFITITSPPDADGNTVSEKFSFEAPDVEYKDDKKGIGYAGTAQGVADRINAFINEHAEKSENYTDEGVNASLYTNSWNYANKTAKEHDYKNFSSEEQWELSNKIIDNLNNSSDYNSVKDQVLGEMKPFLNETAISLKKKYDINTEAGVNSFYEELENVAKKEFTKRILENPEYKKVKNTHEKAVQGFFSQDIPLKMREEGELEVMPDWVNKNPLMKNLVKGAWGTSMVKIPGKSYEFLALNESKKLEDIHSQIEEYENMDPNEEIFYNKGFSTDPKLSIASKKYKASELIPLLEKNKKVYEEKIGQAIVTSKEYQDKLSKIVTPKLFDEDGFNVTGEEFWRMIGDQGVQMIGAALSMGGTTLLQEGGGAYTEITTAKAAMKMFPDMDKNKAIAKFQKLPMEGKGSQTEAILDLIEKGEADLDTAFTIGATNAGLDLISNTIVIGKAAKFLPKSLTRDFISQRYKEFLKGGWKSVGKDVGIGSFTEFLTETAQEGVNIFGVGTATGEGISDMVTKENLMRLMEAGGQALITTGPIIGGGQVVSTTAKEMVSRIAAAKDPKHQRNLVNAEKKRINELFEQGRYNQKERDQLFTDLEAIEQSTNFGIIETKKGRENVIKKKAQVLKNEQEQKEIENNPTSKKLGVTPRIDQIRLEEIKKENEALEKEITQEVFASNFEGNGKGLAQFINETKEGPLKDYNIVQFEKLEDVVKAIEAGINKGEIKLDATQQEMFKQFKLGKDNALKIGKTAYLANDIIRKNNKKGDWSSTNAIHHEVLHMIFDSIDPKELTSWMNKTQKLMEGSTDPFIQKVFPNFIQRYGQYLNDKNYWTGAKAGEGDMKPELVEEYFTSLSDAMQAVKLSNINVENGSLFNEMGRLLQGIFSKNTKGSIDFSGLNAENMLEFIKKYNDFNGKGPKYEDVQFKGGTDIREPKVVESKALSPEKLIRIIKNPKKSSSEVAVANKALADQFDLLALKALKYDTRKGDIARENVVSSAREYLPGIIKRFNPRDSKFSTFVTSNIGPKQAVIFEKAKDLTYGETISIDTKEAREVAGDVGTTTNIEDTFVQKINILKDFAITSGVANKIKSLVKVAEGDTFKQVISKYAGKVGELIFDIPAKKIMDGEANLTPTTKYKDGMPIPAEAQNIQRFFQAGENMSKFIKSLPKYNVADKTADIDKIGENIETPRNVFGVAIGLKGLPLNYFYENYTDPRSTSKDPEIKAQSITSPKGRSRGLTTQTQVKKLKPEFINPTPEVIEKAKRDIGITPKNEPNVYNRNIGQLQKGFAKVYSINASLSGGQRFLADKLAKAPVEKKPAIKKQIAGVTAAQGKAAFSKGMLDIINIRSLFELETKGIDKLLRLYGVDSTFDLKTEEGINNFIEEVKTKLLPLMPKEFWFGKGGGTVFTPSYYVVGSSDNKVLKQKYKDLYNNILVPGIKALAKDPDVKFGKPIDGITDFSVSSYSTIFKDGKTIKGNTKAIKNWNEKVATIHKEMWERFNKAIAKDKNNAKVIGNYMKMVGSDTKHWHKLGAQFVGYSKKITGKRFEYEHAMPATSAYLYLMDAALSESNFNTSYNIVIDNYKLIALDKAMDKKLTKVGLQRKMPEGWDLIRDNWWDRYFNDLVNNIDGGIDPNSIIGLDGKTFGEMFNIKKPIVKQNVRESKALNKAIVKARTKVTQSRGITVLDFDDTLATTKSLVRYTTPDGKKGTLNAEQYASTYEDLLDQGYTFDFTDFNKVVKGKIAPLFNKAMKLQGKFGPENMFVLTARPPQAAKAIFDFLKANGLNIPIKNITGLANSTAEAKALWMADKVGEGYNDFYFADDALQNVQAVKNMLDQFDVKSKVQQAKVKFSKGMDENFNNILEEVTGIESKKRFSDIKARKRGASKGKFRFFIPPSHEDFVGLLYNFMGKGKQGNTHRDFFEQALVRPLNRAYREIDTARQAIANDYKSLNKQFPDVKSKLTKKTPDGDFTFQDAIRIYLWNKHGHKVPGLSPTDQAGLSELVMNDNELRAYAETLNVISKQETYVNPTEGWEGGNIRIDLMDATGRVGRAQYLTEFNENTDILFSPENLNKIEAAYGASFRSALEDMLHRIKTGVNRPKGQSGTVNKFINYLNGSVGSVMFFNTRSAILQQMSNVNYLNFADNNIFAAAKAFANQPQYWKDFAFIFNSDMLKQRRGGIGTDINGAELAEAVSRSTNPMGSVIGKLLQLGFLPTQIGDNIAIATGGASFYRNRVNKYIKDGLNKKEAETKAFTDFQNITQSTQQSARPDMTSQQQAAWVGKLILNFLNTPSQYNRIIKKAGSDILNRRITPPNTTQMQSDMSNASRILYYGAAQNLIFYGLQTALFAVMFGLDDEDEEKKAEQFLKKKERVINGAIDTILRGSGIYGVAVSTLKNMMIKFLEQRDKGYNKDESAVIMEMLNFSPVVGIKARKVVNAEKTLNYNKKIIEEMNTFDIDNPQWSAVTNYVEAATNAPVNRLYQKSINLRNAMDNDYTAFQRALFFSGYTTWSLGLEDTKKMKDIKESVKGKKKSKKESVRKPRTIIIR